MVEGRSIQPLRIDPTIRIVHICAQLMDRNKHVRCWFYFRRRVGKFYIFPEETVSGCIQAGVRSLLLKSCVNIMTLIVAKLRGVVNCAA
jgi:hypothetical protein